MDKILDRLYSYTSFGIKLGLHNINALLNAFEYNKETQKIIHIAGTNGKGSVASMLEAVLLHKGYSVGKYTSPHLVKFNERIAVNREMISDIDIVKYFEKVEEKMEKENIKATFFEITTMMMLLYMKDKKVDYIIMETGLGGRFDATNAVEADISAITNISIDHSQYLGDTLSQIAFEKCGIIKDGQAVFIGTKQKELIEESKKKTKNFKVATDKDYKIYLKKEFTTIVKIDNKEFEIPLYGKFQGENFLLARDILNYLGLSDIEIKNGIKETIWSGRFEIFSKKPLVIVDGAHNEDAALRLSENIIENFTKDEVVLLCSMLKDKEVDKVLKIFSKFTDTVIFTSLKHHLRGMTEIELSEKGKGYFNNIFSENELRTAYNKALNMNKKAIIIAGSLYLAGDFKKEG